MKVQQNDFLYVDYYDKYDSIMQFNKNKNIYLHGWYPFVEGYSKEFINSVIEELDYTPTHCLEPFSGSGTTAVELQKRKIKCTSFEVNPFMHLLAKCKMRTDYTQKGLNKQIKKVRDYLEDNTSLVHENFPEYKSIIKREGSSKWIFNTNTINGIMDIKLAISKVTDKKYRELFEIALASLFLEVSNVYRDGKSLKYKKKKNDFQRIEIHEKFYSKISNVIYVDIKKINQYKRDEGKLFSNYSFCYLGDCKKTIEKLDDDSIDLIITSPPYLNSRDYTDSYMIELWMLDLIKDYGQLKKLRGNTLKSHVQFSWESSPTLDIYELTSALNQLEEHREQFWNKNLPNMIKGYFCDMDVLFYQFSKKVMKNGMVYFNVANSAYYGIEIKVDKIISRIAEIHGFQVCEIRRARKISPSSQQKGKIPFLTEVVIVMRKK